ESPQGSDSCH
ncbi:transposase, partial [Escherichia coli EC1865]